MSSVLLYSGGVNSTAMAIALIEDHGWRGPLLWADTGTNWPETLDYIETFKARLARHGLTLTPQPTNSTDRGETYRMPLIVYCERNQTIPTFRHRWCNDKWIRRPNKRWCKKKGIDTLLVGIAADEAQRARPSDKSKRYPLVELNITRDDCHRIIAKAGLPPAPRSNCWMCPYQNRSQWIQLKKQHPDLYQRALALEDMLPQKQEKPLTIYPHASLPDLAAAAEARNAAFHHWLAQEDNQ